MVFKIDMRNMNSTETEKIYIKEKNYIREMRNQPLNKVCKPDFECDLHCHTTRSDGNDTPAELIKIAAECRMKAIAIVDHDINPPETLINDSGPQQPIKEYADLYGIKLVLGYEFSCDTFVDDVHILGYELDWNNELLKNEVKRARLSKTQAYKRLCELLTLHGMPVDFNLDILHYIDKNGNFCERKPDEVERKHIFEVMALKGYAKTWHEAKLIVRDNPQLNVRREKINPIDAIKIIKESRGIAVLAHPYLIDEDVNSKIFGNISRDEYVERLIDAGIEGIESMYTYDKTSYKGRLSPLEIKAAVENKYKDKVRFFTGGSDYHNDAKKGADNPRRVGEAGISFNEFKKIFKNYLF
ncbi:MAG: PHP domain-containing protein [Actinobacteria bacterium]|nr:PHP domain-containing protein [Actinomycetota bacterium]